MNQPSNSPPSKAYPPLVPTPPKTAPPLTWEGRFVEVIFQKMIIFHRSQSRIQRRSKCQVMISHRIGIEPRLASSDPVFFGIRHVDQLGGNGVINFSPIVFLAIFWHHFSTFSHHLEGILKYYHHIEIFSQHILSYITIILPSYCHIIKLSYFVPLTSSGSAARKMAML